MTKEANTVFARQGTTIFSIMSALAEDHDAINLGQGFPDDEGPKFIREAAARAIIEGPNQYPPMMGMPALRQAIAEHEKRFYDREVDWRSQVMVTSGATEALADCLMALLNPGDEAILIEPAYDCYLPMIEAAGATARSVRLDPDNWTLPQEAFAAAFNERTKLVVLNSPMNPTGKVFTPEELAFIADQLIAHDVYAVCDEVYEHLVFKGRSHVSLLSLPGMAERCLRIGSAGKTFSLTGWKVGYVIGPAALIDIVAKAHQFITFTTPPPLQSAVAEALQQDDGYFIGLSRDLATKRDLLGEGLDKVGFQTMPCEGTYFISADMRPLGYHGTDWEFCDEITRHAGVAAVPFSAFYRDDAGNLTSPIPAHLIRFSFCKRPEVLGESVERLLRYFG